MKIAIVNDQPIAVEALKRALAFEAGYELAWVAVDGEEAVKRAAIQRPDIILMDLIMPVMDGVEATRRIMQENPCAIIIVTGDTELQTNRVFEAMGHGALDAVNTPIVGSSPEAIAPLLRKIYNVGRLIGRFDKRPSQLRAASQNIDTPRLVAIGASAGGPAALALVLQQLPADFRAAVILVQHVDEVFAAGMADWLGTQSTLPVRLAKEGDAPEPGTVLLAGTNNHLRLMRSGKLAYTPEPVSLVYRPSIDVFFESVAISWPHQAAGVLLTGMGRDGAKGLKMMQEHGFHTIAQDEASSAVYGMPKAAAALGAASEILPLDRIAARLKTVFG